MPIAAAGIFKFPDELGITHEVARGTVSDHAPVWMNLDPDVTSVFDPHYGGSKVSRARGAFQLGMPETGDEIRANRNSKIYHLNGCPGFNRMSGRNIIVFESTSAAEASGYRKARNCS